MALTPLFNRLIIKPVTAKRERKLSSGIIVASTGYDKTEELHGEVVAIGADVKYVKVGDTVTFPAYGYDTVTDDSETAQDFMSVREQDVLAVITK